MKKLFFLLTLLAAPATFVQAQWTEVTHPEPNQFANCLLSKNGKLYVAMNSGILVSNNNGVSWDSTGSRLVNTAMAPKFLAATDNWIYTAGVAGGGGAGANPIRYDGTQWSADTIGLPQYESRTLFAHHNRVYIAHVGNTALSLYTKLDSETSWTPTSIPVPNAIFGVYALNNTYYAVSGGYKKIWSSTDGINFTETSYTVPSEIICTYSADDAVYLGTQYGLYKSTDGLNFTRIDAGFPTYAGVLGPGMRSIHVEGDEVYVSSAWVSAVFKSNSAVNDTVWTSLSNSDPIFEAEVTSVVVHNNILFATQAIWSGDKSPVMRYGTPSVGIDEAKESIFVQAYPNPVQHILQVETKEDANVQIISVLGTTLASQKLSAGKNSIDVSAYSPGIYFIRTEKGGVLRFVKK